jgi:hypothetical protein
MSRRTDSGPPSDWERRQVFRLASAASDILAAHDAAAIGAANVRDQTSRLWGPLHDVAVVSYARPFTQNAAGPLASRWSKFSDKIRQRLHDDLIHLRNTQIAHADVPERSVTVIPAGVYYFGTEREVTIFTVSSERFDPDWFDAIAEHCQLLGTELYSELNRELDRLFTSRPHENPRYPFDVLTGERQPPVGKVAPLSGNLSPFVRGPDPNFR